MQERSPARARGRRHRLQARDRKRSLVLAAVAAGEIVAAVVALVVVGGGSASSAPSGPSRGVDAAAGSRTPTRSAAADPLDVQAVAWVARSLPSSSRVLADPTVAAGLAARGFPRVTPDSSTSGVRFVVATDRLRSTAGENPAVSRLLTGSQPVAVVTSAGRSVSVREVTSATGAQLAADAANRRQAEQELLGNPRLHASAAAAKVLAAGGLDLRSATVLALAAASGPLDLVDVVVDPAEQAAGRPARVVDVRTTEGDLRPMLQAVDPAYRLASVTSRPGGTLRLTWPVAIR